jgi:eukaryotic-like serine/threonine-protein kinase
MMRPSVAHATADPARLAELFAEAVERPPEGRAELLRACPDEGLRGELESLLAAHDGAAGGFLEGLDAGRGAALLDAAGGGGATGRRIGPYRILREIGRGGMGVVYLAERVEGGFEQHVAVKLVKRGMDSEAILHRFRRERQILASLEHPGVARLLDGGGTEDGQPYFAMEHVDGAPLPAACDARGLAVEERLRLFVEACRAVHYAHGRRVVHRDLKPSNIYLTAERRVKLLDFGVAKLLAPDGGGTDTTLTLSGVRALTPEYAAPEQVRGELVTAAADVYSLGVVLYELLTGRRPYRVDTGTTEALVRTVCDADPEPPSRGEPSADAARARGLTPALLRRRLRGDLDTIVLQALRKEPERRYASAEALAGDLERHLDGRPVEARRDDARYRSARFLRRHRSALAAAGAVAVSVLATLAATDGIRPRVALRPAVAVAGFRNLTGREDAAWLGTALGEMLATELGTGEKLRTISPEAVSRVKADVAGAGPDPADPAALSRLRGDLGADFAVSGSYVALGPDRLRVDVRLVDARGGGTLLAVTETGREADLFDLVGRTGARLRAHLGAAAPPEPTRLQAALPADPRAARLYAEGLGRWRLMDAPGARGLLEEAVAAQPDFALAHAALSAALTDLGRDAAARDSARRAFELSATLPRAERLFVEARFREAGHEWDKAIDLYRSLAAFFPDDLEYGLRLAAVQTRAGRARDALATVETLRALPPPLSADPRIDLAESLSAASLSEDARARAAAARAAEKGKATGARLLHAEARLREGQSLVLLRDAPRALAAFEESRGIFAGLGYRLGVARALHEVGAVRRERGDLPAAQAAFEQALAVCREVGYGTGTGVALGNLGLVAQQRGDLDEAARLHGEALRVQQQLGDKRRQAAALNNLATVARLRDQLAEARATHDKALALYRQLEDRRGMATQFHNMANVLVDEGDLPAAARNFDESLAITRVLGDRRGIAYILHNRGHLFVTRGELAAGRADLEQALALRRSLADRAAAARSLAGLGNLLALEGDFAGSRRMLEEAMATRRDLGERGGEAEVRAFLADLALREGRPALAGEVLSGVREEFGRQRRGGDEAHALALQARAAHETGRTAEADAAIERAATLLRTTQGIRPRLIVELTLARARSAALRAGPCGDASRQVLRSLRDAARTATERGFAILALEARFALAEGEARCGLPGARTRLREVEKAARQIGFLSLAETARTAAVPGAAPPAGRTPKS